MKHILLILLSCATAGFGAELHLKPESRLWLEGDSSLHAFSSTANIVNIYSELPDQADALKPGTLQKFELRVQVKSLKSGKKGLDKKMYEELKAAKFPEIVFKMSAYEIGKATGTLSIAGKEKEIDLNFEASQDADGLKVSGSETLLMSDYGIKPPSMMLGAIKTADKITVRFNLILEVKNQKEAR